MAVPNVHTLCAHPPPTSPTPPTLPERERLFHDLLVRANVPVLHDLLVRANVLALLADHLVAALGEGLVEERVIHGTPR